jgi:hypothetical protein
MITCPVSYTRTIGPFTLIQTRFTHLQLFSIVINISHTCITYTCSHTHMTNTYVTHTNFILKKPLHNTLVRGYKEIILGQILISGMNFTI